MSCGCTETGDGHGFPPVAAVTWCSRLRLSWCVVVRGVVLVPPFFPGFRAAALLETVTATGFHPWLRLRGVRGCG